MFCRFYTPLNSKSLCNPTVLILRGLDFFDPKLIDILLEGLQGIQRLFKFYPGIGFRDPDSFQ